MDPYIFKVIKNIIKGKKRMNFLDIALLPLALFLLKTPAENHEVRQTLNIKNNKITNCESNFSNSVNHILINEGGLVNDQYDSGGITKYGISLRYLKNYEKEDPTILKIVDTNNNKIIDSSDIINLTKENAVLIYKKGWWDKYNFGAITYSPLASKVFDMAVNMGSFTAIRLLQKACIKNNKKADLEINGRLDKRTLDFINSLSDRDADHLLRRFKIEAIHHYDKIALNKPILKRFLSGWVKRANR